MSFILDALRKSEHERQRQTGPGIADIRAGAASRSPFPIWALALGALLALNMIVVIVLAFRSHSTPEVAPVTVACASADGHSATRADTACTSLASLCGALQHPGPACARPGGAALDRRTSAGTGSRAYPAA